MTQLQWQTKYSPTRRQSDREGERAGGVERERERYLHLAILSSTAKQRHLAARLQFGEMQKKDTQHIYTQIYIGTHCQVENFCSTCGNTDARNQGDHARSSCSFNLLLNQAAAKVTQ